MVLDDITILTGGGGGGPLTYEWYEGATHLGSGETLDYTFPLGEHTVTLIVGSGAQTDSDDVIITVEDTIAPEFGEEYSDLTVEQQTPDGTSLYWKTVVSDICDASPEVLWSHTPPYMFPLGETVVTGTAEDFSGNSTSDAFTVTVVDTTAPEVSLDVLIDTLWPPNHKMHLCATVDGISDICDTDPDVDIVVTSNEPINGKGDGNTDYDWEVVDNGDGTHDIYLRAERQGSHTGREYTITVTVTDFSGNVTQVSGTVTVPHSQGKGGGGKGKK